VPYQATLHDKGSRKTLSSDPLNSGWFSKPPSFRTLLSRDEHLFLSPLPSPEGGGNGELTPTHLEPEGGGEGRVPLSVQWTSPPLKRRPFDIPMPTILHTKGCVRGVHLKGPRSGWGVFFGNLGGVSRVRNVPMVV